MAVEERIAIVETELKYITKKLDEIVDTRLPQIYKSLETIQSNWIIHKVECEKSGKLMGKDKAIVYGAFLTAMSLIIIEVIRSFF